MTTLWEPMEACLSNLQTFRPSCSREWTCTSTRAEPQSIETHMVLTVSKVSTLTAPMSSHQDSLAQQLTSVFMITHEISMYIISSLKPLQTSQSRVTIATGDLKPSQILSTISLAPKSMGSCRKLTEMAITQLPSRP